jgi:diaminopimelate decarboxylase
MSNRLKDNIAGYPVTELAAKYGTPVFLYERELIEKRIAELKDFDVVRYAQKACCNLAVLSIMRKNGVVVDVVSAGEILRAVKAGYRTGPGSRDIVYTSDLFDEDAVEFIRKYQIPVNAGSPDMIIQLGKFAPDSKVSLRINPGFGHGHSQKVNTGGSLSKHGIWYEDLEACLRLGREAGVHINGLHMHIGSGSDLKHLSRVCNAMVEAALRVGPDLEIINSGGGLPIPYHKDEPRINLGEYFGLWHKAKRVIEKEVKHEITLEIEPGRYLVAESGTLLTQIRSVKNTGGTDFYLVDAGFDTLIRPAMYGAYHEISIARANGDMKHSGEHEVVVGGPLCESCDVFTQEEGGFVSKRLLPRAQAGDYLLIHDAGAYGATMSSNYNGRRLAAEALLSQTGHELIRERQTFDAMLQFERIPETVR